MPPQVTRDLWERGIEEVRTILALIDDIHLPVRPPSTGKGDYLNVQVCRPIDRMVAGHTELRPNILSEASVQTVREQLRLWISARIRIVSHAQWPALLRLINEKDGQVSLSDIISSPHTRKLYSVFHPVLHDWSGGDVALPVLTACLQRLSGKKVNLTRPSSAARARRAAAEPESITCH